jgi:hypothetical protein
MRAGRVALLIALVAGLTACGGSSTRTVGGCAIEIEFEPSATAAQIERFRGRVLAIPHVETVQLVGRREHLRRFLAQLRAADDGSPEIDVVRARARVLLGSQLIAFPEHELDVPGILAELQELPEAVSSVAERDACG